VRISHTTPTSKRTRAAFATAFLAALSLLATTSLASPFPLVERVKPGAFAPATSGHNSEKIETYEIERNARRSRSVAFTISPKQLPDPSDGGLIEANGEVTLTTTCVDGSERCIGRPYGYSPEVGMRLILTGKKQGVGGKTSVPISRRVSRTCRQDRPHRNHHCPLVIESSKLRVPDVRKLPCKPARCRINMVVDASDGKAKDGNVIVVGADRPDGGIDQDKGRLNAVVYGRGADRGETRRSASPVSKQIPMDAEGAADQRVIFSVKVKHLERGDVLIARGRHLADISHLPYSAFVSGELIVTTKRDAAESRGLARKTISYRGSMSAVNGVNCTQGRSDYQSPCLTRKAGLARVQRDVENRKGRDVPLFVNLVSRSFPKLSGSGGGDAAIIRGGFLEVRRLKR
jgi:hypothetical protein